MTEFLLPSAALEARITLTQGEPRSGTIFLGARVAQHEGPETPLEMLNRPDPFFPFRPTGNGEVLLVAKGQTVALAVEDAPIGDPDRLSAARQLHLEVVLTNGATLSGRASVELPEHHARPLDYLNASIEPFFAISTDERTHYVNRAHVLFARPRGGD